MQIYLCVFLLTLLITSSSVFLIVYIKKRKELKIIKNNLTEANDFLQRLISNAPAMLYTMDDNFRLTFLSPNCFEISGYKPYELIADPSIRVIHDDDLELVYNTRKAISITGKKVIEYRIKTKQGKLKWVKDIINISKDESGKLKEIHGVILDITEKKELENQVIDQKNFIETVFNTVPDILAVKDINSKFTHVNNVYAELLGLPKNEIIGKMDYDFSPKKYAELFIKEDKEVINNKKPIFREHKIIGIGGEKWINYKKTPLINSKNEVEGIVVIVRDITAQKRITEELENQKELFRNIVENMPSAFIIINKDEEFSVDFINSKLTEVLGYTLEDIPNGEKWFENAYPQPEQRDKVIKIWNEAVKKINSLKIVTEDFDVTCKSGEIKNIKFKLVEIKNLNKLFVILEDITEQKKAEEKLKKSEENYRSIFNNVGDAIYIYDAETNQIIDQNIKASEMGGYSKEEIIKTDIESTDDGSFYSSKLLQKKAEKALQGDAQIFEWLGIKKDGTKFWSEINMESGYFSGKKRLIASVRNISKRKKTEEELKKSEEKFRAIFNAASVGIAILNKHGDYILVNKVWLKMLGYKESEIGEIKNTDIISETEFDTDNSDKISQMNKDYVERKFIRKDKTEFWGALSVLPIHNEENEIDSIMTIIVDIDQRKRSEMELKKQYEFLQVLMDSIPNAVFYTDNNFRLIRYNHLFRKLLTITDEEMNNGDIFTLLGEEFKEIYRSYIDKDKINRISSFEFKLNTHGGESKECIINKSPFHNLDGSLAGFVGVIVDISEIRKREREINELNRTLEKRVAEELNKRKKQQDLLIQKSKLESLGELAAGIAHEINQPLTGISMGLDNILFKISTDTINNEYLKTKCDSLFTDIERIKSIIEHIRVFSREQNTMLFEKIDVNESVRNALSLIQTQYSNHHIEVKLELEEAISYAIGNKYKLEQVLINLLSNAKDAVDEKGLSMSTFDYTKKIFIRTSSDKFKVYLEVEDNGVGITEVNLNNIFEPFFTTKDPDKGTGLGLAVSYGLIKGMKGDIIAESKKDEFTKLKVVLAKY